MPYFLGVDLGTTYTAAAIHRDGRTTTVDLGTRAAAIPSVVYLRDDEEILTGEAANRRGATDPARVAREFKRRVGDTTPILLGGSPYSADALMSKLLRWVVDAVTEREGERPAGIGIAHPANWGPYKKELLDQAIARADLDHAATITEPEAAVTYYASQERVPSGAVVAVYDLGGGTFDAAVVRKTDDAVELLGTPEGIERLGGIDFDEAVFAHVAASLGGALDQLDPDDPSAMAAVARLRSECVEAKEALSADTEVSIPVLLPNLSTEVRLTRAELEAMIRPPLTDSLTAVRRALRSAGIEPDELHAVLLAGGSSRVPLVSQMVSAELGRPVAVDAHPKHGVAMGAALSAAQHEVAGAPSAPQPAAPVLPAAATPPPPVPAPTVPDPDPEPVAPLAAEAPAPPEPTVAVSAAAPPSDPPRAEQGGPRFEPTAGGGGGSRRWWIPVAVVALVLVAVAAAIALRPDDPDEEAGPGTTEASETTDATEGTSSTSAPAVCEGATSPCIEITAVAVEGDSLVVDWTAANFDPNVADVHAHFFWNTFTAEEAGTNAADFGATPGVWELTDEQPFRSDQELVVSAKPPEADQLCVTAAQAPAHAVIDPTVFHCVPFAG